MQLVIDNPNPRLVTDNPNPKAVTISFPPSLLLTQEFSRFSLQQSPEATKASPLFGVLYQRAKGVAQIDFLLSTQEATVSFISKFIEWTPKEQNHFLNFVSASNNIQALVDPTAMKHNFNALPMPDEERLTVKLVKQTIETAAKDVMRRDGGDIILIDTPMERDTFTAQVALLGSCSGCVHSKENTLRTIEQYIQSALTGLKNSPQFATHPKVQDLQFRGIQSVPINRKGFYSLNKPSQS